MNKNIMASTMAQFIILDKRLEGNPEPFRMQKGVTFSLVYEEFKLFLQRFTSDKMYEPYSQSLAMPFEEISRLVLAKDEEQYKRCYFRCVATAICKEIWYAEQYKKPATWITHLFDCKDKLTLSVLDALYGRVYQMTSTELTNTMCAKGYDFKRSIPSLYWKQWVYSNILWYYSTFPKVPTWNLALDTLP